MSFKSGFQMPTPSSTPYPLMSPEMQCDSQSHPQYEVPPAGLPPYSQHPPSYQNIFPANIPQMAPYGPPPPYYPPSNYSNSVSPQAFFPHYQELPQQPLSEAPFHYHHHQQQQEYYSLNSNLPHQCGHRPSSVGSTFDCAPSCPLALDEPPSSTPQGHSERENINRVTSIGFEEVNSNSPPISLYPSLPDNFQSRESSVNENFSRGATPLPSNLVLLWEGSKPVKVFFVQREGHVVSPDQLLNFCAYKFPPTTVVSSSSSSVRSSSGHTRSATVLLKADKTWRLGLSKQNSFIVKGLQGELAFYDNSTSPARFVVVILPKEINSDEKQRLSVLLKASSSMIDEPSNIVDKLESGVESVFGSLTGNVNSAFKKGTPELHKTTKWLRKGTGQVVRFGGSFVSKGIHLVSDNVKDKDAPKVLSSQHSELLEGLKMYRDALNKSKVTKVSVPK